LPALLEPLKRPTSPFARRGGPRGAHWVEPALAADVQYTERTSAGILRHPVYRGLRER